MTAKEAYAFLRKTLTNRKAVSCVEYTTLFVFEVAPEDYNPAKEPLLDSLISVNKKTGQIQDFQPFFIPIEEYRAGKRITDFQ